MKIVVLITTKIIIFFTFTILPSSIFAQVYRDNFDDLKEDSWAIWGNASKWNTKRGFLRSTIQTPFDIDSNVFQFIGFPKPYEKFEITYNDKLIQRKIKNPGHDNFTISVNYLGTDDASFGIALGKLFPNLPGDNPFFYFFYTHRIHAVRLNGWGGRAPFELWRHSQHNDTLWKTWELKSMQVRFNKGHFQWFADGEKRDEFEDPEFSSIEILGFVLTGYKEEGEGSAWVDSFKITGPGLAILPQAKLATTWGELKQQQ